MFIYLITFFVSYLFMKIAWKNINHKFPFYLFSILTILIPSLLAGFRDTTVGHDINIYMTPLFESLNDNNGWMTVGMFIADTELESVFVIFNFIISWFTDEIFWAFFIQEVIVLGLIYSTCYKLRKRMNTPLYFLLYLITMFCSSMTLARQIFAIAMIIFSYTYIIDRKWKSFVICIAIAYFMHHSALLALPLYPLSIYCSNKKKEFSNSKILMIIIGGFLLYVFFPTIINFFISYGILPHKYVKYTEAEFSTHKIDLILALLCFCCSKINKKETQINQEIKILSIIVFFMLLCGSYNDVAQRIAYYYNYFLYIKILMLFYKCKPLLEKKYSTIAVSMALIAYVYLAITYGFAEAIPYTSKILGI